MIESCFHKTCLFKRKSFLRGKECARKVQIRVMTPLVGVVTPVQQLPTYFRPFIGAHFTPFLTGDFEPISREWLSHHSVEQSIIPDFSILHAYQWKQVPGTGTRKPAAGTWKKPRKAMEEGKKKQSWDVFIGFAYHEPILHVGLSLGEMMRAPWKWWAPSYLNPLLEPFKRWYTQ